MSWRRRAVDQVKRWERLVKYNGMSWTCSREEKARVTSRGEDTATWEGRTGLKISSIKTKHMEQRPSREANRSSASQEIPLILFNPKVHSRIHNSPPPLSILSHIDPVHSPIHLPKIILILSSHLRLCLPSGLLPSGFPTKTLYAPLLSPYVLHALPISVFLIWSPEWYLVRSTEHKASCYVIFSITLLPHPS